MHDDEFSVLVTVGTDYHRFDRLTDWVERWLSRMPDATIQCRVQHGTSRPAEGATNTPYLDHDTLQTEMERARIVVTHGGPASVFEARQNGHIPICVPRDPTRGEHVDSHQLTFARRLALDGLVVLCETQDQFDLEMSSIFFDADRQRALQIGLHKPPAGLPSLARVVEDVVQGAHSGRRRGWPSRRRGGPQL